MLHLLLALIPAVLTRQRSFWDGDLQPRTIESASGRYSLYLDPTDREGEGPGVYELSVEGEVAWRRELPWTLLEAVVSDRGSVIGFRYGQEPGTYGTLVIVVLGSNGEVLGSSVIPRQAPEHFHGLATPAVLGLVLDEDRNRATVIATEPGQGFLEDEVWWTYDLNDGSRLSETRPPARYGPIAERRVRRWEVAAIPGIDLTLVHYWLWTDPGDEDADYIDGARFALVDDAGAPVWSLDWPEDYEVPGDPDGEWELEQLLESVGVVLDVGARGFSLGRVRENVRVDFRIEGEPGSEDWAVVETGRSPWSPESPEEVPQEEAPRVELPLLGRVRLGRNETETEPPWEVRAFDFDADGILHLVRWDARRDEHVLAEVDSRGIVLHETRIVNFGDTLDSWRFAGNGVWLRWAYEWPETDELEQADLPIPTRVWRVHAQSGSSELVTRFVLPDGFLPDDLEPTPEGGFVVADSGGPLLIAFGPGGEKRMELRGGGSASGPLQHFEPNDVAVLPDGRIAVLNDDEEIQVWRPDGTFSHAFGLPKARRFSSRAIRPDLDGGILLVETTGDDQHGSKVVRAWRLDATGTVRARLAVRHPDGRQVESDLAVAPDGSIWMTDRHALHSLDDSGAVTCTLGAAPEADVLHDPRAAAVDGEGRIYVQDDLTASVHVFDRDGTHSHVLEALPADTRKHPWGTYFAFGPDGEVDVSCDFREYLSFRLDRGRVGTRTFPEYRVAFLPGSGWTWGSDDDLVLRDERGSEKRRIQRRPGDRDWISTSFPPAITRDGRMAVLSGGLALFTVEGDPIETIPLPAGTWGTPSFAGQWIAIHERGKPFVHLTNVETGETVRFDLDDEPECAAISPEGKELWVVVPEKSELRRYALPR